MNFKLTLVSSVCPTTSWGYFPPQEGKPEQEPGGSCPQPRVSQPSRTHVQAGEGSGESSSAWFSTACAYLCLWRHFRTSLRASGSCSVVCAGWQLGMPPEPAGADSLLHAAEQEQIRSHFASLPRRVGGRQKISNKKT